MMSKARAQRSALCGAPRLNGALSRSKGVTASRAARLRAHAAAAAAVEGVHQHLSKPDLVQTTPNTPDGWAPELSEKYEVINPATGDTLIEMSSCSTAETEAAIERAAQAWPGWRKQTAFERASFLMRWKGLIQDNEDDIAKIMTLECGKPLAEAHNEISAGLATLDWMAGEAVRVNGDVLQPASRNLQMITMKQPVGVVGAITPWNFPMAMITRKVGPALAAGCTVVLKPSEQTPLSAYALVKLAYDAGLPEGVLNVVSGDATAIGEALLNSNTVRKIGFTGSTKVGKYLMERSAQTLKRVSMELGGNAPFIVFEDADLEAAAKGLMASGLRNAGQVCIAANRVMVHESVHDEFSKILTEQAKQIQVGNGMDENTTMGPCINAKQRDWAQETVQDAVDQGAEVLCGGKVPDGLDAGFFYSPTLLGKATKDMKVYQTETFAPVIPLFTFKTDEEAIAMGNDTLYGLAGYFYSNDLTRVFNVAAELEYGMVGVNEITVEMASAPFGGIKQSGMGRENGKSGIHEFLEEKFVCMGLRS